MVYGNIRIPGKLYVSGICHDELGPFFLGSENTPCNQRMARRCIGPDDENAPGIFDLANRICHRPASESGGQTCHRGRMSETGAVINVVGADHRSGEFLCQIILLIGHFCRHQNTDAVRPVGVNNFL